MPKLEGEVYKPAPAVYINSIATCRYIIDVHCFICRLSDSTVSEDAGIELRILGSNKGCWDAGVLFAVSCMLLIYFASSLKVIQTFFNCKKVSVEKYFFCLAQQIEVG